MTESKMQSKSVNIDENIERTYCFYYETSSLSLYPGHMHATYELSLVTEGDLMLKSNNKRVLIKAPSLIMHRPFTFHRGNTTAETKQYKRYVLNFRANLLSQLASFGIETKKIERYNICVVSLNENQTYEVKNIFDNLLNTHADLTARRELLTGLLIEYCIRLMKDEKNLTVGIVSRPYIDDVLRYIAENYAEKITIDSLAAMCFISRAKLTADFRGEMDMSIGKYIELVRISETMRVIVQDKKTMSEAARLCGFCSESRFIEVYRKNFGITPGEHLKYMQ